MTNVVVGPGLVPGDVKVRCLACKRERVVRETEVESACPWCTNETKRAFEEARRLATVGRIMQKKMLTRPTTSGPRRMMTCHRHGLTPWEGHVECESCKSTFVSPYPESCTCGIRLMPAERPNVSFSGLPVCPLCVATRTYQEAGT